MRRPIPREILFGNPERVSPKLSPDGRRLAYLAPDAGALNIWAGPTQGPARPVTADRGRGIRSYFWAPDGASLLYVQDKNGDENWHLYQVPLPGGDEKDLTPHPGIQAQVIAADPKFPRDLLIGLNLKDKRVHDVYRVDLQTGVLKPETSNPGNVTGWLADADLQVRAARAVRPDGGTELLVRDRPGEAWRVFLSWGPDDQGGAHGFTPDGRGLYVESSHDSDATCLWEMSLDGARRQRLAAHDGADLSGVLVHPRDYHAQAAAFAAERLSWTVLDPALGPHFEALANLCEGDFQIVSRDDDDSAWLVLYQSDRRPARYYRYSLRDRAGAFLFSARPGLESHALSAMRPVSIAASDGLKLPAYLTLPEGLKPRSLPAPGVSGAGVPPPTETGRGLPLVLLVHGGPWARDHWGFNPEVQWLADQGFAVLQVNYRGSMGFGKKFLHAGDREWGARMQDDLTDAVRWAIERGVADPARVAIFGASYGGYAALCGAAFTPDLYRCAVDIVGPSRLSTLIKSIPPYWEPLRRIFDLRVGNVDTEPEFLESRSPLSKAGEIRIPLLIAQGANDPRVKKEESEQIVSALRAKDRPVEYLLFEDEGHGFAKPENRLRFYARAEEFLSRHLGASPLASKAS